MVAPEFLIVWRKNPMFPAHSPEVRKYYILVLCLLLTGFLQALSSCGSPV